MLGGQGGCDTTLELEPADEPCAGRALENLRPDRNRTSEDLWLAAAVSPIVGAVQTPDDDIGKLVA